MRREQAKVQYERSAGRQQCVPVVRPHILHGWQPSRLICGRSPPSLYRCQRDEAVAVFQSLLVDLVRHGDASWRALREALATDPRADICRELDATTQAR